MKSLEEMKEWLTSRKRQFPGSGMEPLPKWLAELNDEIRQNNETIDAILAALAERTDGPSVTEAEVDRIADAMRCADDSQWTRGDMIRFIISELKLIRGNPASVGVIIEEGNDE